MLSSRDRLCPLPSGGAHGPACPHGVNGRAYLAKPGQGKAGKPGTTGRVLGTKTLRWMSSAFMSNVGSQIMDYHGLISFPPFRVSFSQHLHKKRGELSL